MDVQPAAFTHTYDETLALIIEARDYMALWIRHGNHSTYRIGGLRFSCEALRVTSRLTQVMAWLMIQRAVLEGELSPEDSISETHRLAGHDICLTTEGIDDPALPLELRILMDRSYRLYRRIARLDEMAMSRTALMH